MKFSLIATTSVVALLPAGIAQAQATTGSSSATLQAEAAVPATGQATAQMEQVQPTGNTRVAAQDANAQPIGDIVVTAQKRSERLSRTPLAVTAISQASLDQQGVGSVGDLNGTAPNVQISQSSGEPTTAFTIRGISSNNLTGLGNPAIAFHVDGVYVSRPVGLDQLLYDLDRVEVLRGPQGTLYGRSATAGSINVVTARPEFDQFSGKADLAYGNYNQVTARALVNVPITSTLAIRASGIYERNDGYEGTAGTFGRYEKANDWSARVAALWKPSDRFSWYLTLDHYANHGVPSYGTVINPSSPIDVRDRPVGGNSSLDIIQTNVRSRAEFKATDHLSLTYLAGYSYLKDIVVSYGDTTAPVFGDNNSLNHLQDHTQSHEVDLNVDYGSAFHALIGAFYFRENQSPYFFYFNLPAGGLSVRYSSPSVIQESKAIFGQGTVGLARGLNLTGGVRYTKDSAEAKSFFTYFCGLNTPYASTLACPGVDNSRSGHWSAVTWRTALDYQITPTLFSYASVSTGYKPGGFGDNGTPQFDPEHVTNYEAGLKTQAFRNRLSLNLAVFYMNYTNLQVSTPGTTTAGTPALITANAAGAHLYGFELEYGLKLTNHDRISGFVAGLHAKYTDFPAGPDPISGGTAPVSLAGNYLTRSPKLSGQVRYEHVIDLANGATITPSVDFYVQSKMYLREYNAPVDLQRSYTKTGINIGYVSANKSLRIDLFANNLENRNVKETATIFNSIYSTTYQAPRTFGGRVGFSF